jgi:hypothetical protein
VSRGGELGHVPAGLGDEDLSDDLAEARDALQQLPGRQKRLHQLIDPRRQRFDVLGVDVDPIQEQPGHERVMRGEPPVQRLGQHRDLGPHPPLREAAITAGSAVPLLSIRAWSINRPDTPVMSVATEDSLMLASLNLEMIMKSTFGGAGCGRWSGH